MIGVEQVRETPVLIVEWSFYDQSKDWITTRLDGGVLEYLGKLVAEGKIDPV